MKALKTSIGQLGFILLAVLAATTIMISCGGGGGDGNGDGPPDNSDDRASDAQALGCCPHALWGRGLRIFRRRFWK